MEKSFVKAILVYALFIAAFSSVSIWGILQEYKYGGNPSLIKDSDFIEDDEESTGKEQDPVDLLVRVHDIGKDSISTKSAISLMYDLKIEHPRIVLAQMKLESGNFSSGLAKNNNNYFGMKHPRSRPTMSIGNNNGYATFKSWSYSVLDYAIWQRKYASGLTEDEYLEKLSERYAEDKMYVSKIRIIADSLTIKD